MKKKEPLVKYLKLTYIVQFRSSKILGAGVWISSWKGCYVEEDWIEVGVEVEREDSRKEQKFWKTVVV